MTTSRKPGAGDADPSIHLARVQRGMPSATIARSGVTSTEDVDRLRKSSSSRVGVAEPATPSDPVRHLHPFAIRATPGATSLESVAEPAKPNLIQRTAVINS